MATHEFKIDKNILYSIISKQAGTLQKAFLELTMNSIDAGANVIRMEFDGLNFSFFDDGKGFENEDEIHKFFGTFGTPHEEGDAIYGKFRMGRGQIMAFSKNSWHSNTFFMDVDIKNRGINYNFKSEQEFVNGCKISGTLYEELEAFEVKEFEKEFKEFIRFAQVPIYLNNELINESIESIKWDIITDEAYIQIDNKRNLSVYNLGVKVREYTRWDIGFGGVVISKKQLEVNFARNDILRKSCPIWKSIQKEINSLIKQKSKESATKNTPLTDSEIAVMSKKLITGELDYLVGRKLKLFTDIQGKQHSLSKILSYKKLTVADKNNKIGNKVHEREISFVLNENVLENFGVKNINELFKGLKEQCRNKLRDSELLSKEYTLLRKDSDSFSLERLLIENIEGFKEQIQTTCVHLKKEELTLKQQLALDVLNKHEIKVRNILNRYCTPKAKKRDIIAGESEVAEAWTDGEIYIAINKELLNFAMQGVPGFTKLVNILLHEYLHRHSDIASHSHDLVFYEIYHNVSHHYLTHCRYKFQGMDGEVSYTEYDKNKRNALGYIAFAMAKSYFGLLEKNQLRIPQTAMLLSAKAYNKLYRQY